MLAALLLPIGRNNPRDTHDGWYRRRLDKSFEDQSLEFKKINEKRRESIESALAAIYEEMPKVTKEAINLPLVSNKIEQAEIPQIDWTKFALQVENVDRMLKLYREQLDEEEAAILCLST